MDQVFINNLDISAIIGIHEHERSQPQRIRVNLVLHTDVTRPAQTDAIADAVNYQLICEDVTRLARTARCQLVERLAVLIAEHLLHHYAVCQVEVSVEKPDILPHTESVGVRISRSK